jgi:hypothetical protein
MAERCEYEVQRMANIIRNNAKLVALGLETLRSKKPIAALWGDVAKQRKGTSACHTATSGAVCSSFGMNGNRTVAR